jgi:acyl-CoA reductase-like NAD-dependent aldehyde dehydrogenase
VTAKYRSPAPPNPVAADGSADSHRPRPLAGGSRKIEYEGGVYLRPTVVLCESFQHPLANKEFICPYVTVLEVPQQEMLSRIGYSLAVSAITRDPGFIHQLKRFPDIERLNIGPVSTMKVSWDQPHEGNMFEFLWQRRSIEQGW